MGGGLPVFPVHRATEYRSIFTTTRIQKPTHLMSSELYKFPFDSIKAKRCLIEIENLNPLVTLVHYAQRG